MHGLISTLRSAVPPSSKPIDLTKSDWLEESLSTVLQHMWCLDPERSPPLAGASNERTADEAELALYRRIMDSLVLVVINYWSVERPGAVGGRHTATFVNPDNFRTFKAKKIREIGDVTEQNYLITPEIRDAVQRQKRARIERTWFDRWPRYHAKPLSAPVGFTLNNALLRSARPGAAFISWFPGDNKPTTRLTPLSLNAGKGEMKSWALPPGLTGPPPPDLEHFIGAFRGMVGCDAEPEYQDPVAIAAMVGWLIQFFGDLGGRCFFSIPAIVRVHSAKGGEAVNRSLRAVLSISMNHRWDPDLYQAAWQFFTGIANQILCDILTSEYVAYAYARWERNKSNAVYLASHPLGTRLKWIRILSDDLRSELARPYSPARDARLVELANRLSRRAEAALNFVNYINLLSDMLAETAARDVLASRRNNSQQPDVPGAHWIDLRAVIEDAAAKATDKGTGSRKIELLHLGERHPILVPRRLCEGDLARHQHKEDELIGLLFSELLENAANSGTPSDDGTIPVLLEIKQEGSVLFIIMENLIRPSLVEKAGETATRLCERKDDLRLASGLTLVRELLDLLQLGQVEFGVQRPMPFRWRGLRGAHHIWSTSIRVRI
jgi:hypothetical protein